LTIHEIDVGGTYFLNPPPKHTPLIDMAISVLRIVNREAYESDKKTLIDLLDTIYDKLRITEESKGKLEMVLEKTNTNILYNLPNKLSQTTKEKCSNTGCWLFIYNNDELLKMIK
jgi:hypothetical protein